jgi:hypothetical protein
MSKLTDNLPGFGTEIPSEVVASFAFINCQKA